MIESRRWSWLLGEAVVFALILSAMAAAYFSRS